MHCASCEELIKDSVAEFDGVKSVSADHKQGKVCVEFDEKHMDEREIFWIKELKSTNGKIGYNICEGGKSFRVMRGENHPFFGKKHSQKSKDIIKYKRKFQKMTDEQKEILRQKWLGDENPGKNKSEETIKKLSESIKKLNRVGEKSPRYGKKHSEETKKHWSEIRKNKNMGGTNPDAMRYFVESPENEILIFETQKAVMDFLGCSGAFFSYKKYKGYNLIGKEKINKKK